MSKHVSTDEEIWMRDRIRMRERNDLRFIDEESPSLHQWVEKRRKKIEAIEHAPLAFENTPWATSRWFGYVTSCVNIEWGSDRRGRWKKYIFCEVSVCAWAIIKFLCYILTYVTYAKWGEPGRFNFRIIKFSAEDGPASERTANFFSILRLLHGKNPHQRHNILFSPIFAAKRFGYFS